MARMERDSSGLEHHSSPRVARTGYSRHDAGCEMDKIDGYRIRLITRLGIIVPHLLPQLPSGCLRAVNRLPVRSLRYTLSSYGSADRRTNILTYRTLLRGEGRCQRHR